MSAGKLPEGVEITVSIYVTSDAEGISTRVNLVGDVHLPGMMPMPSMDVGAIISKLPLRELAEDWRMMTRDEIAKYKRQESEESSES